MTDKEKLIEAVKKARTEILKEYCGQTSEFKEIELDGKIQFADRCLELIEEILP